MFGSGPRHRIDGDACAVAAPASGLLLKPRGDNVYFGVSDTGDPGQFGEFTKAVGQHPAVIESFRTWGSDFPDSIKRWQTARARPMLHITTADSHDGHELISPEGSPLAPATSTWFASTSSSGPSTCAAYIRPLGEPNRCLNIYSSYECAGQPARRRPPAALVPARLPPHLRDRPRRRQAAEDQRAARRSRPAAAERPTRAACRKRRWRSSGARCPPARRGSAANLPASTSTPAALGRLGRHRLLRLLSRMGRAEPALRRFRPTSRSRSPSGASKPGDDPSFVPRLFAWVKAPPAGKMLIYYQDFGSSSPYRIQNYPASLGVLRAELRSPPLPAFANGAPRSPPPPPARFWRGSGPGRHAPALSRRARALARAALRCRGTPDFGRA